MYKKCLALLLSLALICGFTPAARAAESELISAPSGVLMEASTGKILFEKNAHVQRPCASVTKVMTLLLVTEELSGGGLDMNDIVTASEHASSMGGSDIWLEPGEKMSVRDLIKATVVASANDAAVALAEQISGSEEAFVARMNSRAAELGMRDTVFKNCNGLDEDGHVTSAFDVALMSRELCRHREIFEFTSIWLDYLRDGKTQIVNTNKLLKSYKGITGLKTGTTSAAGCCISATAERGGMSLIAVVLGAESGKQRFADAASLLDYGFAEYSIKEINAPDDLPLELKVEGGMEKTVPIACEISSNAVQSKSSPDEPQISVELPEALQAPVLEGEKIGEVVCRLGDDGQSFPVIACREVPKATYRLVLCKAFESAIKL